MCPRARCVPSTVSGRLGWALWCLGGDRQELLRGYLGLVLWAVDQSICHPMCVLDTPRSCSRAGPEFDCGTLERILISFVTNKDVWLTVIAGHYFMKGKGLI